MASTAIGSERISRVVGYKIKKGDFRESLPNLPQRIAILAEANEDNQNDLDLSPVQLLSAKQAGELYGYGSPIYQIMRILKPVNNDGVGGIPIIAYPQAKAPGASQKILAIAPTGTATGSGTHSIKIAGRYGVDGEVYDVNIEAGDNVAIICQKITDAINNVLGSPVQAVDFDYEARLQTKWAGLTAEGLSVSVDNNGYDLGISYAVNILQNAAGTPSVASALNLFQNNWNTIVINSYGLVTSVLDALEAFNGVADPDVPTGRYQGVIMRPFIAIAGDVSEDPSAVTDARSAQMTNAVAPAPLSEGFHFEAAANMAYLFAINSQNTPHLDVGGRYYPDMPTPDIIGAMAVYTNRDAIVKKGCSTVDLNAGRYQVQDFVTTYHPVGEVPPQFRYARNLMLDFNVRYGYYLLEVVNVVDHTILRNEDATTAPNVIKPKQWIQILQAFADDLVDRALIVDADFMKDSIAVDINANNPDRLDTFFRYKRSGVARIASTDAEAGFYFGSAN